MITGVAGTIKWHYYTAAAINNYTVTRSKRGDWSMAAIVVLSDAYKMAQRPLVFIAKTKRGEWRWPVLSIERESGDRAHMLTAKLGPPERILKTPPPAVDPREPRVRTSPRIYLETNQWAALASSFRRSNG